MTHICVGKLTIIGSDNGLSPGRHQAFIWTNDGILLCGPLGTNFSEILIEIHTFSFKIMHLKMSSGKWQPFCLGLNMLNSFWDHICSGWELGTFVRGWRSSSMWLGPVYGHHQGCLEQSHLFQFGIMCCMFCTFHVSSRIVANFSEPSLLYQ